jgi:sec-independent protein translocase protein TatC
MATALRPIRHEDRLSLVDHLGELRTRLIICVLALVAAGGFCYWQNDRVLEILNQPLAQKISEDTANPDGAGGDPLEQAKRFQSLQRDAYRSTAAALSALAAGDVTPAQRRAIEDAVRRNEQAARSVPADEDAFKPVTLGVAEPFTQTLTTSFYAGFLLVFPLILYQAYAFVLPAFTPRERRIALPLMALVPVLFLAGVAFGYFVVLQRAIGFLQNFNDENFDILVQARDYYKFVVLFLGGIGLLFQIPVGVLAVTRTGMVTPAQLRKNRGYVILGVAVLAAVATPTPDPITMLLAMGPLVLLFELSILLSAWLDRVRPPDDGDDDELDPLDPDPED